MSDLKKYIKERKRRDPKFAANYEQGYRALKTAEKDKKAA